ncbi:hypothetical protein TcasGA2_TC007367 [Tribolium castaneum]|uniref:Uncharacterized protein n=1 Tax=Tribolium castaneum TaxID=7070 RepID=D2A007_TRICA|nr:hypothetical protein TcasGA2_TC007367 [Tribolium castaneum]
MGRPAGRAMGAPRAVAAVSGAPPPPEPQSLPSRNVFASVSRPGSMGPWRSSESADGPSGRSHVERDRRDTVTNRRCDVNHTLTANLHASQGGIQRLLVALGEGRGSGASAHCKFS